MLLVPELAPCGWCCPYRYPNMRGPFGDKVIWYSVACHDHDMSSKHCVLWMIRWYVVVALVGSASASRFTA